MSDSILTSIKKLLGIEEDYDHYDPDIIMHINSVFLILNQLGVGPPNGFSIEDKTKEWTDYLQAESILQIVKSYVYLKVRLMFDPPLNNSLIENIKSMISEYEWRMMIAVDPKPVTQEVIYDD